MSVYLVTTNRRLRGTVPSALEIALNTRGVIVLDSRDPEMVKIEASEEVIDALREKVGDTHFVDLETRHGLH